MFAGTACFKCHRFAGEGGSAGPDLTGVGGRFNARNLLESIIEPSKVISDQYEATMFQTTSGRTVVGRIANLHGDRLQIVTDMLAPGKFTSLRRRDIEAMAPSPLSMMPEGLLDTLERDEIFDLMAYLRSRAAALSAPTSLE